MAASFGRRLIIALALAVAAICPAPATTCAWPGQLQLTSHTGPYLIRLAKESTRLCSADGPRMRVTIVNKTRHPLVVRTRPRLRPFASIP